MFTPETGLALAWALVSQSGSGQVLWLELGDSIGPLAGAMDAELGEAMGMAGKGEAEEDRRDLAACRERLRYAICRYQDLERNPRQEWKEEHASLSEGWGANFMREGKVHRVARAERSCPHPRCDERFTDAAVLFQHFQQAHPKPVDDHARERWPVLVPVASAPRLRLTQQRRLRPLRLTQLRRLRRLRLTQLRRLRPLHLGKTLAELGEVCSRGVHGENRTHLFLHTGDGYPQCRIARGRGHREIGLGSELDQLVHCPSQERDLALQRGHALIDLGVDVRLFVVWLEGVRLDSRQSQRR